MRVKEYQLDELARARALADEAAKLHIPMPVLSWQYEIKDTDGNIYEKGISKSNSYTRNALNAIAWVTGLCSKDLATTTYFQDGYISGKIPSTGTIISPLYINRKDATINPLVVLGVSTSAESLDDYKLNETTGLTYGLNSVNSVFNTTTRKLVTSISRTFYNGTAGDITINEAGVEMTNTPYQDEILYIRDVISPVTVGAGQSITWTYITEVSYPNP